MLGAILVPIGVLFALVMRSNESKKEERQRHDEQIKALNDFKNSEENTIPKRDCPYCAETILAKAKVCKHCGKDVEPMET